MASIFLRAIMLLALPTVVNIGSGYIMGRLSGSEQITKRLSDYAKDCADRKMLGLRWLGYNSKEVGRHWGALDAETQEDERRALELDLAFPFIYGGSIAAALLLAWAALGRPFNPAWLVAPIAITMIADWIENLVQLSQLRLFAAAGEAGLHPGWIRVASAATMTKLLFFSVSSLLLIGLVISTVVCGLVRRS
jgi:hypothetical protein